MESGIKPLNKGTGEPGRKGKMLIDTIKDIITETAKGNTLDKVYAGMRYRFDIAQRFQKSKIIYWSGDYEFDYKCNEDDVRRCFNELIAQ